jgi:hypothetical protein
MRAKIGDIVEIQTGVGIAYALHSHRHTDSPKFGSLIRVFDSLYEVRPQNLDHLAQTEVMFSTFFPLQAALKNGLVKVVGNVPVPDSLAALPIFRNGVPHPKTKKVDVWWLWDGTKEWRVGTLTPEERKYPLLGIWNYPLLVERIETHWKPENDPVWGGAA